MGEINKGSRDQLELLSLGSMIAEDSDVRVIDAFFGRFDCDLLGFKTRRKSRLGRSHYGNSTLASIYLFGYLKGIRSSRKLEYHCKTNIEVMWLVHRQTPCFKTICDFRSNNAEGLRNLFVAFRDFCIDQSLYGLKRIAIDGSKFRGQNSKKNSFTPKKIARQLKRIDMELEEYLEEMDQVDGLAKTSERVKELKKRRVAYEQLSDQLEKSGDSQISTTDPDSRSLTVRPGVAEVGYNLQSSVDDRYNLIAEYVVSNKTDHTQLSEVAIKTKKGLKIKEEKTLEVLADKAYHSSEELAICQNNHMETFVARPKTSKQKQFTLDEFKYKKDKNVYVCPAGKALTTNGKWRKKEVRNKVKKFQQYKLPNRICAQCPLAQSCLSEKQLANKKSRTIDRLEYQWAVDKNLATIVAQPEVYKRRQEMVEHPFGTIKRQWGYNYTLLKGMVKVDAEFALIVLAYNFRRVMNIKGKKELIKALKSSFSNFFSLPQLNKDYTMFPTTCTK